VGNGSAADQRFSHRMTSGSQPGRSKLSRSEAQARRERDHRIDADHPGGSAPSRARIVISLPLNSAPTVAISG
jgi:hypothetical protein